VTEQISTMNSFVDGRLDQISWTLTAPGMNFAVRSIYAVTGSTGLREWIWLNYDQRCPSGGYRERPVTIPTGVTQVQIELDDVRLPDGVGSTAAFSLQLYDATGVTQVHSTSFTPTSTSTDVATAAITVTAGTEYLVRVACNVSGQSTFVCGRLRVRPVASSDSFWTTSFRRIEADHSVIQDSNEAGWANPRFPQQSEYAHIDLLTNARRLKVEYYQNVEDFIGARGSPSVFVDGHPIDPPLTTVTGAIAYPEATIPTSSKSMRQVTVYTGAQAATGLPAPALENRGTFVCGIYLPASAQVDVLPDRLSSSAETYVIYGDSKAAGFYSASPGRDSMAFIMRRKGVRVISQTAGGASLYGDVGATLTVDACIPLARKLCRKRPHTIVLEMGRNDFANQKYTPANVVVQLGNLLDAINQVDASVRVQLLTFTHETTETAVSGTTWDAERAAIAALATSRAWVTVVDAARYWSVAEASSYTTDTVHPNDAGQERVVRGILGEEYPWSPSQVSSLYAWWEVGPGMTGGPLSAVTSSGTSPPVVTLSGTGTIACSLRIEVTTAGARGVSRFRWSINDGRSWVQSDVLTAASVVLNPIGVTVLFSAGTYPNNAVYTAVVHVGQVNDKSGNSRHLVGVTSQFPPYASVGINSKPSLQFVPVDFMRITGINVPAPHSVYVVGKYTSQASVRALLGRTAAGTNALFYSVTPTTMDWNDGTVQRSVTVNATIAHCYIIITNGSSSNIRVDGVDNIVSLTNSTITGLGVGADAVNGLGLDGYVSEVMVFSGVLTTDECMALEARSRQKWGTP
jgi:lysophospholipase L1-like esterase